MEKFDIVEFARKNGAFSSIISEDLQYIGDNAQKFADITFHELMFEDMIGYIRTWSFKVDNQTGEIIPYSDGFKFIYSGFNPDEMRKKLAMIDKVKHEKEIRAWVFRAMEKGDHHETV